MIFYFNANGTLKSFVPEKVCQGSNKVNTVYFISPVAPSNVVSAHFVLPDGSELAPQIMTLVKDKYQGEVELFENSLVNVWETEIISAVTQYYGNVRLKFTIENGYGERIVTETVTIEIEKGYKPSEVEETDTYQELIQYVAGVNLDCNRLMGEVEEVKEGLESKLDMAQVEQVKRELDQSLNMVKEDNNLKLSRLETTLLSIANENGLYTISTVEDEFNTRKVAGGQNVINNTPCIVKEIKGCTVVDENSKTFVDATLKGIRCSGNNIVDLSNRKLLDTMYLVDAKRDFSSPYFSLENSVGEALGMANMVEFSLEGSTISWVNNYLYYGLGISLKIAPETTYYFSYVNLSNADNVSISYFDNEGKFIKNNSLNGVSSFTTLKEACYAVLVISSTDVNAETVSIKDLYVGFTDSEYQDYQCSTALFSQPISLGMGETLDLTTGEKTNYSVTEQIHISSSRYVYVCSTDWQEEGFFCVYIVYGVSQNSLGQKRAGNDNKRYDSYYLAYNEDGVFCPTGFYFQLFDEFGKSYKHNGLAVIIGNENDRTVYLKIPNTLFGVTNEQTNEEKINALVSYLTLKPITVRYLTEDIQSNEIVESALDYVVIKDGQEEIVFEDNQACKQDVKIYTVADYYTLTRGNN